MNGFKQEHDFKNDNWLSCLNESEISDDPYQLINDVMIDSGVSFKRFNIFCLK